jgi:hypothetical protein
MQLYISGKHYAIFFNKFPRSKEHLFDYRVRRYIDRNDLSDQIEDVERHHEL